MTFDTNPADYPDDAAMFTAIADEDIIVEDTQELADAAAKAAADAAALAAETQLPVYAIASRRIWVGQYTIDLVADQQVTLPPGQDVVEWVERGWVVHR